MSIDWWQIRDAASGEFRDVTNSDINIMRYRAMETARTSTRLQLAHSPGLDSQAVFVTAFKKALAHEITLIKA